MPLEVSVVVQMMVLSRLVRREWGAVTTTRVCPCVLTFCKAARRSSTCLVCSKSHVALLCYCRRTSQSKAMEWVEPILEQRVPPIASRGREGGGETELCLKALSLILTVGGRFCVLCVKRVLLSLEKGLLDVHERVSLGRRVLAVAG